MMMVQMNKAVVPGQLCLTSARVVPNPNKPITAGGWLRNHVHVGGKGKGKLLVAAPTPTTPIPIQSRRRSCPSMDASQPNADIANNNIRPLIHQEIQICPSIPSSGDPCLDLFSNSLRPWDIDTNHSLVYLKQILPLAWSHNPLTTLKLIFSVESPLFSYRKFETAVFWLLQNHPKTLIRNLHSIADLPRSWSLDILVDILHHLLVHKRGGRYDDLHLHPQRYDRDPDYRLLHDGVMDLFVERLKSDIDKMKQHKLKMKPSDYLTDGGGEVDVDDEDIDAGLLVSGAADCCTTDHDVYRSIFLNESIARRLFPPESDVSEEWERLRKEYLVPLTNYFNRQPKFKIREDCVVKKYLEKVKAGGGENLIKPDALLPNEILKFVQDEDVGEAAELQWKAMMKDIKQKQGKGLSKFKNCLVVGYPDTASLEAEVYARVVMELLVSDLSEGPWKGKLIKYNTSAGKYQLDLIQGHDLKSKFEFIKGRSVHRDFYERIKWTPRTNAKVRDILEVFDLILEVGVNENLKAEQMIKKVIVFTELSRPNFTRSCEIEHELLRGKFDTIRSKYKDKGYGDDAVPHILFWGMFFPVIRVLGFVNNIQASRDWLAYTTTIYSTTFSTTFWKTEGKLACTISWKQSSLTNSIKLSLCSTDSTRTLVRSR